MTCRKLRCKYMTVCVGGGGNLPTLGLLYGLVTATFLHSAASEQHIPQREGGRKKKRVSIEWGRTGNEESVKKGGGVSVYMFESCRRICGEGGVKRVEMHWQRKLVKEGKRVCMEIRGQGQMQCNQSQCWEKREGHKLFPKIFLIIQPWEKSCTCAHTHRVQ